jgi:pimeloyl-ACP methyl ester carboxylesterase
VVTGEGPPVLLLHGFPDTHAVWRLQIPALVQAGYRVIAPDVRGHGATTAPKAVREYRIEKLVADVLGLLDALEIREPVRLIGHDLGAITGWALAGSHPERFACYVALSVGHPNAYRSARGQMLKAWYVGLFQLRGFAEIAMRAANWRMLRTVLRHPEVPAWIADLSRPGRLTAAMSWYRANAPALLTRHFRDTPLPVMGIWSDGDIALVEQQMLESFRYVTGPWRYERIEGASHWLQLDRPQEINRLLLEWLK